MKPAIMAFEFGICVYPHFKCKKPAALFAKKGHWFLFLFDLQNGLSLDCDKQTQY